MDIRKLIEAVDEMNNVSPNDDLLRNVNLAFEALKSVVKPLRSVLQSDINSGLIEADKAQEILQMLYDTAAYISRRKVKLQGNPIKDL